MLDLDILKEFREEKKPAEVYSSRPKSDWGFSRATFYRRLEKLDGQGLVEWKKGQAKITEKGEQFLAIFDPEVEVKSGTVREEPDGRFCISDTETLKRLAQHRFIYITYPSASYILRTILLYAGISTKGLSTNAEKFRAITQSDCRVSLAIDNFENASKQSLVFLRKLALAGRVEKMYVGVNDERKALRNDKLLNFLQELEFENQMGRFKLESDSMNLFPVLLVIFIGFGIILAYRMGLAYAPVYVFFIFLYFLRSSLFREVRK